MFCRLCLMNLNAENAIALFETSGNYSETEILKMIAKHFQLELSRDDPVSTSICQTCSEHLDDFHRFWIFVDQKQSTLRNEFLEVKCEDNILSEGNEESLLDLKDISLEFAEAGSIEEFACANKKDTNNMEELDTAGIAAIDDSGSDSMDDNTSLQTLITRSKSATKSKVSKRKTKKRKVSKVKPEYDTDEEDSDPKSVVKRNEETITNFLKLSCDLCNMPFDNFNELRTHFLTMHQRSAYVKCCGRPYNRPTKLVEHIRWHQNPDVYKCNICQKRYRSKKYLKGHRETHLANDRLNSSCPICNKPFISQKCLKKHILKHENDKDNNCEICNESFFTAQLLRVHNDSVHKNISESDKANDCEICNTSFPTVELLRLHTASDHKNVWHICDTCGKKFKFKPSFKKHLLEHQGIVGPPAQCDICGEWLKNRKTLSSHRAKHVTIKFDCPICGRKCPTRKARKTHINYMHKLKNNLQCNYCEKTFKLARCLEEHVATHTGALLYSCQHCAIEFRSKSNMYVHIKRAHREEWLQSKVARSNDPNLKMCNSGNRDEEAK